MSENRVIRRPSGQKPEIESEAETSTQTLEQPEAVKTEKKSSKKFTKRPAAELMLEIGQIRLKRIIRECVPSPEATAEVQRVSERIAKLEADVKAFAEMGADNRMIELAQDLIVSESFRLKALQERLGNPANVSMDDANVLRHALRLQLKTGKLGIAAIAVAVESAIEAFPVKGTKY